MKNDNISSQQSDKAITQEVSALPKIQETVFVEVTPSEEGKEQVGEAKSASEKVGDLDQKSNSSKAISQTSKQNSDSKQVSSGAPDQKAVTQEANNLRNIEETIFVEVTPSEAEKEEMKQMSVPNDYVSAVQEPNTRYKPAQRQEESSQSKQITDSKTGQPYVLTGTLSLEEGDSKLDQYTVTEQAPMQSEANAVARSTAINQMQELDDKYALGLQDGTLSNVKSADTIEAAVERVQAQRIGKGTQHIADSSASRAETQEAGARREETDGAGSYNYTQNTDPRGPSAMRKQEGDVQRLASSPIRVSAGSDPLGPGAAGEDHQATQQFQMKTLQADSDVGQVQHVLDSMNEEEQTAVFERPSTGKSAEADEPAGREDTTEVVSPLKVGSEELIQMADGEATALLPAKEAGREEHPHEEIQAEEDAFSGTAEIDNLAQQLQDKADELESIERTGPVASPAPAEEEEVAHDVHRERTQNNPLEPPSEDSVSEDVAQEELQATSEVDCQDEHADGIPYEREEDELEQQATGTAGEAVRRAASEEGEVLSRTLTDPQHSEKQEEAAEGEGYDGTGYVLGDAQAFNTEVMSQDPEGTAVAQAETGAMQAAAYLDRYDAELTEFQPVRGDYQAPYIPEQIRESRPHTGTLSASFDQGFDPARHLVYQVGDDITASGEARHPEKEVKRVQAQWAKEAKADKAKFLQRQQQLTDQFSKHEHLRVQQSKYYINKRTPAALAVLDKQLGQQLHHPLVRQLASQKQMRKKLTQQKRYKREQSFDQHLRDRQTAIKQELETSMRTQGQINTILTGLKEPLVQSKNQSRIRTMKMSGYFPHKPRPRKRGDDLRQSSKGPPAPSVKYIAEESRPAVVKLRLKKLKQRGEEKVKSASPAGSLPPKKTRSRPKNKRGMAPAAATSQELRRNPTANSYAEVEIVPAPDIFHNDEESLLHEMIDHTKAVQVMSQLQPVITKARNQAYQDICSTQHEAADKSFVEDSEEDSIATGELADQEASLNPVRKSVSLQVLDGGGKNKRKLSSAQLQKKKHKEWQKFLHFCKANPEAMMSLVEQPAPQYGEGAISPASLASGAPSRNLSPAIMGQGRAAQNYSTVVPASTTMQQAKRVRPQSGRPKANSKMNVAARYDLPRDFKNEPFKIAKGSLSRGSKRGRLRDFSSLTPAAVHQPAHKFGGELSSVGHQSQDDSNRSPARSNQWETINKLGPEDVMVQTIGDQINLTNVSDVQRLPSKQETEAGDKFASHDERQTIASEYTQNTMPGTLPVTSPGTSQQFGFFKASVRGSFEARNLIPIAEETKSPLSHQFKPNSGSNLSQTNIKGRLMRGSNKQRRILTAHPGRARRIGGGNAMLAPNHPSTMSRFQTLTGAGSAKPGMMNLRNLHTLVASPTDTGSGFHVGAQTTKDAEYVKLQSFNSAMRKQSAGLPQTRKRAQTACTDNNRRRKQMLKQRTADYEQEMEAESESPVYQPLLVDGMPEIDAGEVQLASQSPSRNDRHTLPPRQGTAPKSEYPLSYEHRSNSAAMAKITMKRKADRLRAGSAVNVHSEKGTLDEAAQAGEAAVAAAMDVAMGDVSAKNLLWKQLSVEGLQEKTNSLFSNYWFANMRRAEEERKRLALLRKKPKREPYSLAGDIMGKFDVPRVRDWGAGGLYGLTRAQLLELERLANLTPPSHTSSIQREKFEDWKQNILHYHKEVILLEFNQKKEMQTMQEIIQSINYLKN